MVVERQLYLLVHTNTRAIRECAMSDNTVDEVIREKEWTEVPSYIRHLIRAMVQEWLSRVPDPENALSRQWSAFGINAVCRFDDFVLVNAQGHIRASQYHDEFQKLPEEKRKRLCVVYAARLFVARKVLGMYWVSDLECDATLNYLGQT